MPDHPHYHTNQNDFDECCGFGSCMPTRGKAALKSEWRKAQDKLIKAQPNKLTKTRQIRPK